MDLPLHARLIASLVLFAALSFPQRFPTTVIVAAAMSGNTLFPVARFTQGRWINTWPGAKEKERRLPDIRNVPADWLGGPVPGQWAFYRANAGPASITVSGLTNVLGGCDVPTELVYSPAMGRADDIDRDLLPIHLAVVPNVKIEGFRRVPNDSQDFQRAASAIASLYREQEPRLVAEVPNDEWRARARSAAAASREPVTLRWLYRPVVDSTSHIYYFEAVREFRNAETLLGMKFSGWLKLTADGQFLPLTLRGGTYGDDSAEADGGPIQIPRGSLRLADRTFWIMSVRGYESGGFLLYEMTSQEVRQLIAAYHSGC